MQNVDRPRKYFRREPGTAAAKALIEGVQAAVREWHARSAATTLRVAQGCRPAERAWAYQALEELQLGDEGSPGFYVEKVGDGPVRLLGSRARPQPGPVGRGATPSPADTNLTDPWLTAFSALESDVGSSCALCPGHRAAHAGVQQRCRRSLDGWTLQQPYTLHPAMFIP